MAVIVGNLVIWIIFARHWSNHSLPWTGGEQIWLCLMIAWMGVTSYFDMRRGKEESARAQAVWRDQIYSALVWWSGEGRQLASDSGYVLAAVRQLKGLPGGKTQAEIMAGYQDASNPCATEEGARRLANFALERLSQVVADHVDASMRNVDDLAVILRRHFRRDVVLMQEAKSYQLNTAMHGMGDESPTHLVERLLRQHSAIALAREQGLKRIKEIAQGLPESEQEQYIAAATAGINASLDAWMRTQASRTP